MPVKKTTKKSPAKRKPATKKTVAKTVIKSEPGLGAGTIIEKILDTPGIKPVKDLVKAIIWKDGEDCGCEERKARLNKKIGKGHINPVRCLTEKDHKILSDILPKVSASIEFNEMTQLTRVHASVFNYHFEGACATCVSRNRAIIYELKTILKDYENASS